MKSLCRLVILLTMVLLSTASLALDKTNYRTRDGRSWIRLVSSDELEYRHEGTTLLCKYSVQDGSLRVILTVLGTQQVLYFKRTPDGYTSEDGESYMSPAAIADLQRREQAARAAQQRAQQAEAARRAEAERLAREAAQRQAEAKRLADERARQQAEANRLETVKALEASSCTEGEYNVPAGSKLVFMLSAQRDCWTPWLIPENRYWGIKYSVDVVLQFALKDGTLSKEFLNGPIRETPEDLVELLRRRDLIRAIRFKSLKKEPGPISVHW